MVTFSFDENPDSIIFLKLGKRFLSSNGLTYSKHPPSMPIMMFLMYNSPNIRAS